MRPSSRTPGKRLPAALLLTGLVGAAGGPAWSQEPRVAELIAGYRCMMAAPSKTAEPLVVREAPRADAPRLGIAEEPVVAADPPRIAKGYTRILLADGRPGWILRRRLVPWATAASPGLRCLPARMTDGRLGFSYAHPG